ncbi:hypothetical protein EDC04DRAFT_101086 [Pisolithus marmoratus]|nr:hypothetical protein EDC04DRAFT_101086 [Pisolithus marmoratus]
MVVPKSRPVPADNKPRLLPISSSQVEMILPPAWRVRVSVSGPMALIALDALPHTSVEASAKTPNMTTPGAKTPSAEARPMAPWAMTPGAKTPRATTPRVQTSRGQTQTAAPAGTHDPVTIETAPYDSEHLESSPAPSESSLSSLESELRAGDKIPKPNGEAGRPGRGGYNLEEQLGWSADDFKKLKRFINKAMEQHLDTTKCRSLQDLNALGTVCDLATAKFPDLENFAHCWPVLDQIQMRLKYLSSRARWRRRLLDRSVSASRGTTRSL